MKLCKIILILFLVIETIFEFADILKHYADGGITSDDISTFFSVMFIWILYFGAGIMSI